MALQVSGISDIASLLECNYTLLAFMQVNYLLPSEYSCEKCNQNCMIVLCRGLFRFKCTKRFLGKPCGFERSINKNTWFAQSRLSYIQALSIVYCFVSSLNISEASRIIDISPTTLVEWYHFCREICIEATSAKPIHSIGGPGTVVDIDESKIGNTKYHRCRRVEGPYVFGAVQRNSKQCFFVPVKSCDSATLLKIIIDHIKPGTTIISYCWKKYDFLEDQGYQHLIVYHSIQFKDPETSADPNTIENQWWDIKRSLSLSKVRSKNSADYLAEFIWKIMHKQENLFAAFLDAISTLYPV